MSTTYMVQALKKFLSVCAVILFLLFAFVQLNDPDAFVWTTFYLLCASIPLLALFDRCYFYFNASILMLVVIMAARYFPGFLEYLPQAKSEPLMQGMNTQKPYIEETREFLGSCLVIAILSPYTLLAWRRKSKS